MNRKLVGTATLGIILVASCCSRVSASPFTWDPAGASPPLSGAAFTADAIGINYYFRSVIQPDNTFAVHFLEPVTGFTLNGQPVAAPGLGSTYGLYFEMFVTGKNPPPLVPQYTSVQLALIADPGNQDGKPVPNANAINFSNTGPTGAADDITLATGSLVSASMFVEPGTMIRHAHYVTTFAAAPGEGGFFASGIDPSAVLDMLLMALPGNFNDTGPGTVPRINWVTDAPGIGPALGVVSFVPEPISLALFGTGLAALCIVRRSRGTEKKGTPPAP